MTANLYNVYDNEGNIIIKEKTSSEVARKLNVTAMRVANCGNNGQRIRGIYKIEKSGKVAQSQIDYDDRDKRIALAEWDKVVSPFRNVIWVKEDGPDVRRLQLNG